MLGGTQVQHNPHRPQPQPKNPTLPWEVWSPTPRFLQIGILVIDICTGNKVGKKGTLLVHFKEGNPSSHCSFTGEFYLKNKKVQYTCPKKGCQLFEIDIHRDLRWDWWQMGKKSSVHSHFCLFYQKRSWFSYKRDVDVKSACRLVSGGAGGWTWEGSVPSGQRDEEQHYIRGVLSPPELHEPPGLAEQCTSSSSSFPPRCHPFFCIFQRLHHFSARTGEPRAFEKPAQPHCPTARALPWRPEGRILAICIFDISLAFGMKKKKKEEKTPKKLKKKISKRHSMYKKIENNEEM